MNVQEAYNIWAGIYDTDNNKTRDLEAAALRKTLATVSFGTCLEMGCGTGKNTEWLLAKTQQVIAVDFSEEMLIKAKQKISSNKIIFIQADITLPWTWTTIKFELIVFSLILEHIQDLDRIFKKSAERLVSGGYLYIGELHPFRQYQGTKARFETEDGQKIVTCFNHHVSAFTQSAKRNGFEILNLEEYFDENDENTIPRILTILLKKSC